MKQITNFSSVAQALIITGATNQDRLEAAHQIGHNIAEQSRRVMQDSTFRYIGTQAGITREVVTELLHDLSMTAFGDELRVIILEAADKMSLEAGNALLKALEEPPKNVYYMLLTPTLACVMPTLRSRSQIVVVGATALVSPSEQQNFFTQTIPQRFSNIAKLAGRPEQLDFAYQLLQTAQRQQNYSFAQWLQTQLGYSQKSGNLRLLLETSALQAEEMLDV